MNDYEQELREKWSNISYQQGGSLELGIQHPLEWHVGYFSPEAKSIVIVSDEPVSKIESSKSIQASIRSNGTLVIFLRKQNLLLL